MILFWLLTGASSRHLTGLHFGDDTLFVTIHDNASKEPMVTIYGAWLGWRDNADLRDGDQPPTEIFLVLLPTTNDFDELAFWNTYAPQLAVGARDRFVSDEWKPHFVNGTQRSSLGHGHAHVPFSSADLVEKFYSLATRPLRSTEFTSIPPNGECIVALVKLSFPDRNMNGSNTVRLCSQATSREPRTRSLDNVALCVPPVNNAQEWRHSLPQYVAWYTVHHQFAHVYIYARPPFDKSKVWIPLITSGRVTVRAMPLLPIPSSWRTPHTIGNDRCVLLSVVHAYAHRSLGNSHVADGTLFQSFDQVATYAACISRNRDLHEWFAMFDEDEYLSLPSQEPITTTLARLDPSRYDVVNVQLVWYERNASTAPNGVAPFRSDTLMDRHFVRANPQQHIPCFAAHIADYNKHGTGSCTKYFVRSGANAVLTVHHTVPTARRRVLDIHPLDAHLMHLRFMSTLVITQDRNLTQSLLEYCELWPVRSHALLLATNAFAERIHTPAYMLDQSAASHVYLERCREHVGTRSRFIVARIALAAATGLAVSIGTVRWLVRKAREQARIE
jgi:hypothetical protein